ncbi:MAG: sensor histidine kinase [Actinomycetota bacterium]
MNDNTERANKGNERLAWVISGALVASLLIYLLDPDVTILRAIAVMALLVVGSIAVSAARAVRGGGDRAAAPSRESADETFAEVERVLAVTAHEMRGPLTAIVGASTTLRAQHQRLSQIERESLMNMTLRQARHLSLLVDDLLVTADLSSAGATVRPEWTDLESIAERALETTASKRSAHRLDVSVEPVRCNVDPSRTVQILRNLIENAYKYTPHDSTVSVSAMVDGTDLVLRVADDGGGIPVDQQERLFEPYRRGALAHDRAEGIGIGLHVVRRLAEAMGGGVELESSDRGTTFTVSVPCQVMGENRTVMAV